MAVWTKTRRCGGACSDGTRTRRQIILSDARACLRERGGTHGAASVSSSGVSHLQHTPHCSDNQYKWQGLFALYQPTSFPLARPHSLLPVNASKRGRRPVLRGESNPREWRSSGFAALACVSAKSLGQNSRNQNFTKRHNRSTSTHTRPPASECCTASRSSPPASASPGQPRTSSFIQRQFHSRVRPFHLQRRPPPITWTRWSFASVTWRSPRNAHRRCSH